MNVFRSRGAALAGFGGVLFLLAHLLLDGAVPADTASQAEIGVYLSTHHAALLASAWFDGVGSVLLVVFTLCLVASAPTANPEVRRVALLGGALVGGLSLVTDATLLTAIRAAAEGHAAAVAASWQLALALDYMFPVAVLFWIVAFGVVVLQSDLLPRGFGVGAIAFAILDFAVGTAALFSDAAANIGNMVFALLLLGVFAAAIWLVTKGANRTVSTARTMQVSAEGSL